MYRLFLFSVSLTACNHGSVPLLFEMNQVVCLLGTFWADWAFYTTDRSSPKSWLDGWKDGQDWGDET